MIPLQTVPDSALRGGDHSGLRSPEGRQIPVYDPATTAGSHRLPFPGNRILENRFDGVGLAMIASYPLPNRTGNAAGGNNCAANANSSLQRHILVAKINHQLRPVDQLTLRSYLNDSFIDNRGSYPNPAVAPDANINDVRIQSLLAGHTRTFNPSMINEFKVSFFQRKFIDERYGYCKGLAASLGLSGVSDTAFPTVTVPGYATLGRFWSRFPGSGANTR